MGTAAEIRDLYIDTIARGQYARYRASFELDESWEELAEPDRDVFVGNAVDTVDDLAEKGLLPIDVDTRYVGRSLDRRSRYVTGWTEVQQ